MPPRAFLSLRTFDPYGVIRMGSDSLRTNSTHPLNLHSSPGKQRRNSRHPPPAWIQLTDVKQPLPVHTPGPT